MMRTVLMVMLVLAALAPDALAEKRPSLEAIVKVLGAGDHERVLELVDEALESKGLSDHDQARYRYLAAEAHLQLGENAAASEAFGLVLAKRPKATPALVGLGRAEAARGHAKEARAAFTKALALNAKDPHIRLAYGEVLTQAGALEDAGAQLKQAERLLPGNALVARALVEWDLRRGDSTSALARANAQVKRTADHPMGHFLRGLILDRGHQGDKAIAAYEAAIARDDTFLDAHKNLAILCHTDNPTYADLARTKKSLDHYERYFALGGRDPKLKGLYLTTKSIISPYLKPDPKTEAFFREDPSTAKQAALQWGLGVLAADFAALEGVIDWERLHARAKAAGETVPASAKDHKQAVMATYRKELKLKMPKPMLAKAVLKRQEQFTETRVADGAVRIVFPAELGGDAVEVAETKGRWYIVGLPKK